MFVILSVRHRQGAEPVPWMLALVERSCACNKRLSTRADVNSLTVRPSAAPAQRLPAR